MVLLDQALLLDVEGLALRRELQSLEHGHLVRELVDNGLLERRLTFVVLNELSLDRHLGHQRLQGMTQLRRVQRIDVRLGRDHGS